MPDVSNTPSELVTPDDAKADLETPTTRLELWRLVRSGIGDSEHTRYVYMVWSVDDDQPYWFRSPEAATDYITARREGDTETAERLAAAHA